MAAGVPAQGLQLLYSSRYGIVDKYDFGGDLRHVFCCRHWLGSCLCSVERRMFAGITSVVPSSTDREYMTGIDRDTISDAASGADG